MGHGAAALTTARGTDEAPMAHGGGCTKGQRPQGLKAVAHTTGYAGGEHRRPRHSCDRRRGEDAAHGGGQWWCKGQVAAAVHGVEAG